MLPVTFTVWVPLLLPAKIARPRCGHRTAIRPCRSGVIPHVDHRDVLNRGVGVQNADPVEVVAWHHRATGLVAIHRQVAHRHGAAAPEVIAITDCRVAP